MKYLVEIVDKLKFENQESEYKLKLERNQDESEKWMKSIVGFSNAEGGVIYVGVSNEGAAVGLTRNESMTTRTLFISI